MKITIDDQALVAREFACKETGNGGRELTIRTVDDMQVQLVLTRKDVLQLTQALLYSSPNPVTILEVPK